MNKNDQEHKTGAGVAAPEPDTNHRKWTLKERTVSAHELMLDSMEQHAAAPNINPKFMQTAREEARRISDFFDEVDRLAPYLEEEIAKNERFAGRSYMDVFNSLPMYSVQIFVSKDPEGLVSIVKQSSSSNITSQIFKGFDENELDDIIALVHMLRAARKRARRDADSRRAKEKQADYSKIKYADGGTIETNVDKFAKTFFSIPMQEEVQERGKEPLLPPESLAAQGIPIGYERNGAKKPVSLYFDCSFDVTLLRQYDIEPSFDALDFFICMALDNLFREGNTEVSLTKILREIGITHNPKSGEVTDLYRRLMKAFATTIIYDSREVMEDRKKAGTVEIKHLLEIKLSGRFSGQKVIDGKVTILGYSAFRDVAAPLDRLTEYNKDFFRLYTGKRTRRYYAVLLFLIQQIAWMRNAKSKRANKILYESLYAATGANDRRAKAQTREMMKRILDQVFIPAGHVASWEEATSGNAGVYIHIIHIKKTQVENKSG